MPQISLYVDNDIYSEVSERAKEEDVSLSGWVSDRIAASFEYVYPKNFFSLFGGLADEPPVERPSPSDFSGDVPREPLGGA